MLIAGMQGQIRNQFIMNVTIPSAQMQEIKKLENKKIKDVEFISRLNCSFISFYILLIFLL